jgi:hypothetical protein
VPKASRLSDAQSGSLAQKVVMMGWGWCISGVVYSLSVSIDTIHIAQTAPGAERARRVRIPEYRDAAAAHSARHGLRRVNDRARWRAKGGIFVPQYAMSGAPRSSRSSSRRSRRC